MVEYFVKVGIALIFVSLGIIFFMPSEQRAKKKKRKKLKSIAQEPNLIQERLEQKIAQLEKQIGALRSETSSFDKKEKEQARLLMVEQVKVKKFQEKLSQEREWKKREKGNIDKKGKVFEKLKKELIEVQENFSKAHGKNLRFERKVGELQKENHALLEQRRSLEGENTQLKTKGDSDRREIATLKKDNARLVKKKEDEQWVAKSEYNRVSKLLKEKEKELERISRESG